MRRRFYRQRATGAQSADLAVAVLAAARQLVFGGADRFAPVGPLAREVGDGSGQLPHRAGHRDAEYTLTALQQVDDLLGRGALVNGGAVGEQRDVCQITDAALTKVIDRDPDVVQ